MHDCNSVQTLKICLLSHMQHRDLQVGDVAYLDVAWSTSFRQVCPEPSAVWQSDQGSVAMEAVPHEAPLVFKELDLHLSSPW